MKIAIIGAGITGLSAAYRLTQAGHSVTIYEASDTPGGLGTYVQVGDNYIERFYHHFFQSDRHVIALIQELELGSSLHFYHSKTSIFYDGKLHAFGGPVDLLRFSPLSFLTRIRLGLALAYLKYAPVNNETLDQIKAAQWLKKYVGPEGYRVIWKPLLTGKFEQWADTIPLAWLKDRLRDRTFKLGYLDGSAKVLFDSLIHAIAKQGGVLRLETPVSAVSDEGDHVAVTSKNKTVTYDACIVTTVSPIAKKLIQNNLDHDVSKILESQDQLGAVCVLLELDRQVQPHYWINVNDRTQPILVAVEHTNLIPSTEYGGRHLIYLANYLHRTHPRYNMSENEIIREYATFLKKVNPAFSSSWIKKAHLSRVPRTQTLFSTGSLHNRPPKQITPRIYLGNIDQMYPHDRNLNLGVELGTELASMVSRR